MLQSTYVLDEKRRVRSGELHYFDHPMFGVIAQVNPYAAPATDSPVDAPVSPAAVPDTDASGEAAVETPVPVPGHRARQAPY